MIHPVTRPAFTHSLKTNALNFKLLPDKFPKIDIARDHIPSHQGGSRVLEQRATKLVEHFERKKRDLSFVVFPIIEEPIAADAVTGHTFDTRNFNCRIVVRSAAMVTEKIVTL